MESNKTQEFVMLATGKSVAVSTELTQQNPEEEERVTIEKVHNVWGSSSGARSDFFDIYCKNRSTEIQRLEQQEKQWKEDMENKMFQTIRYTRMQKEQQKLEKRKEKRNKRKMKSKGRTTQADKRHALSPHSDNERHMMVSFSDKSDQNCIGSQNDPESSAHADDGVCNGNNDNQTCIKMPAIVIHDDLTGTF